MRRQHDVRLQVAALLALLVVESTAVSADCRSEVETAIHELDMPDRAYRSETTDQTYRSITEFIPPDRTREITYAANWVQRVKEYFMGPLEMILIGNRMWVHENKTWVEDTVQITHTPEALPPEATFSCLEDVAFEGKTYAGYQMRSQLTWQSVAVFSGTGIRNIQQEEALKLLKEAPTHWRTILVDRETGLPAYVIITPTNQLDSPTSKTHYTYPRDLTIEPPVH
jgi:hypothetical protein